VDCDSSFTHNLLPQSPQSKRLFVVLTMPIQCPITTNRISQEEFRILASEVIQHVFAIHSEFGRFFDELIYKRELVSRMKGVELEVPILVTYDGFVKTYRADVLVNGVGLFEFKAASEIHSVHRGQTLNYLLLLNLAHSKVINIRPQRVQHEFVNCPNQLSELRNPVVVDQRWNIAIAGAANFRDIIMSLITDWGAGLETALYEEAVTHFIGGETNVVLPVKVFGKNGHIAD
jgi:GxxExxY protein